MFSAIFRKEWRQLRLLRWVVIAIAAILPAAFVAGAEMGRRGLAPFGAVRGTSNAEMFGELLPAVVALGLWPLAALLFGAQAWSGDIAAGTESFLLERPVRRGTIWTARLAAACGSLLTTGAATAVLVGGVALLGGRGLSSRAIVLALTGIVVTGLALAGAAGASAFVRAPLPALLLGLILAALPAILAGTLAKGFPHAAFGIVPVGAVVPWLLVPALVVASMVASCRGEPAGRGRIRRATAVVVGVAAASVAVFLVVGPAAMAWSTSPRWGGFDAAASPSGGAAALVRGEWARKGVTVVDLNTGATVASFAPPTRGVLWHPDGKRLAVITAAGRLGSESPRTRVEFFEIPGGRLAPAVELDQDHLFGEVWHGERLIAMSLRTEGGGAAAARDYEILVIDPATGGIDIVPFARGARQCGLVGPTDAADVFAVVVEDDGGSSRNDIASARWRAYRLDESGRPESEPVGAADGFPVFWWGPVSPSGRYFAFRREENGVRRHLLYDTEGRSLLVPLESPGSRSGWVAGDAEIVVVRGDDATKLFLVRPDGGSRTLREWTGRRVGVRVEVSPDHRKVLVVTTPGGDATTGIVRPRPSFDAWGLPSESRGAEFETAIFDVDTGRWTILDPAANPPPPAGSITWAGPSALLRSAPGFLEVVAIDGVGSRRVVFGREPASSR